MGEAPMKRARTQSEDFQYTILGFLENKIRYAECDVGIEKSASSSKACRSCMNAGSE